MGNRRRYRAPTVLAAILIAALLQSLMPETVPGDGRLYDLALAARARLPPAEPAGEAAKVAIAAAWRRRPWTRRRVPSLLPSGPTW